MRILGSNDPILYNIKNIELLLKEPSGKKNLVQTLSQKKPCSIQILT